MSQSFKRRLVRERVLQILYAYSMNKESLESLVNGILSDISDKSDRDFANDLVNRVLIHKDELESMIKQRVDNWDLNRIALIDNILLQMGICELMYFPDIPPKVSINEEIEIAKIYSTEGSGKFINGILDAVLYELKDTGKLDKSGRGLIEETVTKALPQK
ncbi:MAG: transcription antitermination factor NusB [Ignavibacteriaceae bacterium]